MIRDTLRNHNVYCSFHHNATSRRVAEIRLRGKDNCFVLVYLFWAAGGVALDVFVTAVDADTVGIHSQHQPAEQVHLRS